MTFISKKSIFFGLTFLLVIMVAPLVTSALSPGLSPFGGVVTKVEYCRCSNNIMITYNRVKSSMPEYLTIRFSTKIYPYGTIKRGDYILGTTISPDLCVTARRCRRTYITQLIGIVGSSK